MTLSPRLLEILCCPAEWEGRPCHGSLEETADGLLCRTCGLCYPIEDGIPVMLPDHAKRKEHP